jgi:hypothetical protein
VDPRKLHTEYGLDSRLEYQGCAFCGGTPSTIDHVPSKTLLTKPYPANLPTVPACIDCNQGFSKDEQYLACLLDCVIHGSTHSVDLPESTRKTFKRSPTLAERIARGSYINEKSELVWVPEKDRVENVAVKLARGHTLYDLSCHELETPSVVSCVPLMSMSDNQRHAFEGAGAGQRTTWPGEIGSRAFLRAVGSNGLWITVQAGRYRYAIENGWTQIVIAEYLGCTVIW